jgi:hypothetical protein
MKQPRDVAEVSGQYMRRLMIGLVFYATFESVRRFLQVQGIMRPMLVVACVVTALHPLWYAPPILFDCGILTIEQPRAPTHPPLAALRFFSLLCVFRASTALFTVSVSEPPACV